VDWTAYMLPVNPKEKNLMWDTSSANEGTWS